MRSNDQATGFAMATLRRAWSRTAAVVLLAALVAGCPPGGDNNGDSDAGSDAGDVQDASFELELGRKVEGRFEPFSSEPQLEIVSGFQGGWHLEPGLKVTGLDREDFVVVGGYWVVDVDSGKFLHMGSMPDEPDSPVTFRVDRSAFDEQDGGLIRKYHQVRLDVESADDVAGNAVELRVSMRLEGGGTAWTSREVILVDEINELGR